MPKCVAELDNVVLHHDFEATEDGIDRKIELISVGTEIVADSMQSVWCVYVGIHTGGVGGEEAGVGWEAREGIKSFFEVKGASDEGWLDPGCLLQM